MDRITRIIRTIVVLPIIVAACQQSLLAEKATLVATARQSILVKDVQRHAKVLASDLFEGREAGSRGGWASGAYLGQQLKQLKLATGGDEGDFYQPFGNGFRNVLAIIPGSDPELKEEFIVVGAHYDHVGYGAWNNSRGPIGQIHNGADDNASGTAALLEIIEAFQQHGLSPRRSILFAFWDAEEKGLLGSKHWVEHPTVPLEKIRFVLNTDMIGRLRENSVEVYGHRTSVGFRSWLAEHNEPYGFLLQFDPMIKADSDHHPFYLKRVPFLMLHTGKHDEYHRPTDDIETLNYAGIEKMTRLLFDLCYQAAQREESIHFREAVVQEAANGLPRPNISPPTFPARLGITWDAQLAQQRIIQVTSVNFNAPAAFAGIRFGDRITSFGGRNIADFEDFRTLVLTAPKSVKVGVQRQGFPQPFEAEVQLVGEPIGLGMQWGTDEAEPDCVITTQMIPGSPAYVAGIRPGDRIVRVGRDTFATAEEFSALLEEVKSPFTLVVERYGVFQTLKVKRVTFNQEAQVKADNQ